MDKKTKNEKSKSKKIKNIKKSNKNKEKTTISTNTTINEQKKMEQDTKIPLNQNKSKNQKIKSKKYSIDNKESNSYSNTNNITDSSELFIDKKKAFKAEINNRKIIIKQKNNRNSEDKNEKNPNNKEYNLNPFISNNKENKNRKKSFHFNNKENNLNNNDNINIKEDNKNINIEINNNINNYDNNFNNNKNEKDNEKITNNNDKNNYNRYTMDFSFEKKLLNSLEIKDKRYINKNKFFNKINKNKNFSKERKTEGSFGTIIHQKKLKLFSFSNNPNNQHSNNVNENALASISSKNIFHELSNKEKLFKGIKNDIKKISQRKTQGSNRKHKTLEKRISKKKIKAFKTNRNRINNNIDLNSLNNNDNKETMKLEEKISKNREILFSSQANNLKDESKEENKDNNSDTNYTNTKNSQKNNTNINSFVSLNEKNINNNSLQQFNNMKNKPFNFLPNKSELIKSNSNKSKNDLIENEKNLDKNEEKDKMINFKKSISPTTIDIDLEASNTSDNFNNNKFLLSSDRLTSSQNNVSSIHSILKENKNNVNKNTIYNKLNMNNIQPLYDNKNIINNNNRSPQIRRKKEKNKKILKTKTEMNENILNNKNHKIIDENNNTKNNYNFSLQLNETKDLKKNDINNINNNINSKDDISSLNTLDNDSFKKSTVKKLIKNNQYKALLTEITNINLNKEKDKENKDKEKEQKKIQKKYKFSERRRGSLHEKPYRKLTESRENYYDLYRKAFNSKVIEQKFSFRPRTKKKNFYHKLNYNKYKSIEDDKILNKKISTISFNSNQRKFLDTDLNIEELSLSLNKNILNNSLNENNLYDENEKDNNKNLILDLNHFIPIDEDKLINTISRPIYSSENQSKKLKEVKIKNKDKK